MCCTIKLTFTLARQSYGVPRGTIKIIEQIGRRRRPGGRVLVAKKKLVIGWTGAIVLEAQLQAKALPVQAILNGARIEKGETMAPN